MRVETVVMPVLHTNCYVMTADNGALVIDPGAGGTKALSRALAALTVPLTAIAITHAHPDHCFAAGALANEFEVPVFIHRDDARRLDDPFAADPALHPLLAGAGINEPYVVPTCVVAVDAGRQGKVVTVGAFEVNWMHSPGHTPGASVLCFAAAPAPDSVLPPLAAPLGTGPTVATGDVLFADSIGRMDLAGGSQAQMAATLANLIEMLPPNATLLPGHGRATTMERELAMNPFLRGRAALAD